MPHTDAMVGAYDRGLAQCYENGYSGRENHGLTSVGWKAFKEWVPENGNSMSEGSIPLICGTAWKLLTAADEGRGLVQTRLCPHRDYAEYFRRPPFLSGASGV